MAAGKSEQAPKVRLRGWAGRNAALAIARRRAGVQAPRAGEGRQKGANEQSV